MQPTKAKYLGIFYTFIIALAQVFGVTMFIVWAINSRFLSQNDSLITIFSYFDKCVPILLLFCFLFAKKIGPQVILNIDYKRKASNVLLKISTWSMTVSFFVFYCFMVYKDYGTGNMEKFQEGAYMTFGALIAIYLLNAIPSSVLYAFK